MNIGERIQSARRAAGLKQSELAEKIGVAVVTIGQYERGKREPNIDMIIELSEALGVSVTYLLGVTDENGRMTSGSFADSSDFEFIKMLGLDDPACRAAYFNNGGQIEVVSKERMNKAFDSLNKYGQAKAVERVEELTEIPKYQKTSPPDSTKDGD